MPYSGQGKLRNLIEYILFFTKSATFLHRPYRCAERHLPGAEWLAGWPERYHPLGRRPSNVWEIDIDTQGMWDHSAGRHACPFPQELVARCLDLTTDKGDIVLDPFAGIGTVIAQAVAMGRHGVGLELNPTHDETFHEHVLPDFQARWEAGAASRRLARLDQRAEGELILRLRLLKAGKEVLRAVQRLANARSDGHPAAEVRTVVILANGEPEFDVDEGTVSRACGTLLVVADVSAAEREKLLAEITPMLVMSPFTALSLDLSMQVVDPVGLRDLVDVEQLQEFGISRHGAYTAPPDARLFEELPSLLTDIRLRTTVRGDKSTELERARQRGERQLLVSELATGDPLPVIAQRIGVSHVELRELLIRHGLAEEPKSFAVALPGQIAMPSD